MVKFTPSKLTLALLSTGLMAVSASSFAFAQQTDEEKEQAKKADQEVEVIEVKGLRGSLIKSINTKRFSSNVVDAISAEDIGKLPDSSIADSLSRISGLAAQRLEGRASVISIRGFGENESTTTLNGREQVSIGDGRGVEFDLYPSEIMSGVSVYKTPNASMTGEGIAGVIDMQTISPLSKAEQVIVINGQYEKNGHDAVVDGYDNTGHRLNFSYIDQFADDTLGVALAFNTMESPGQEKQFGRHGDPFLYDLTDEEGNSYTGIKGANIKGRSSVLERDSVMAVVEYAPTDDLTITVDSLYVDFSDKRYIGAIEFGFNNCDDEGKFPDCEYTINSVENGFVTGATYRNFPFYVKNNQEHRTADLLNLGLNIEYRVNDDLTVTFDASSSEVERDLYQHATFGGASSFAGNEVTYQLNKDGSGGTFESSLDYGDPSVVGLGDIMGWDLAGERSNPKVEDEIKSFKLAAKHMLESDVFDSIEFGLAYRERDKQKTISYSKTDVLPSAMIPGTNVAAISPEYLLGTVDLTHANMGHTLIFDQEALLSSGAVYSETDVTYSWGKINDAFQVSEEVSAAFVQGNISTEIAGKSVRGNVGLRYIKTEQSSIGDTFGWSGIDTKLDFSHSYSNFLPSVNIIVDVSDDEILRFGFAKTIARPTMDDMKGGILVEPTSWSGNPDDTDINGNYWRASGGNYQLEAREANGFDLSYENYFSDEGYFSVALFYKKIKNWNFDSVYETELPLDDASLSTHPVASNIDGFSDKTATVNAKENGGEGDLRGVELSVSFPFKMIDESLEGFGIFASHTMVKQDMKDFNGDDYTLPGLSERVSTITAYYEKDGIQVRTSMRKRSDFTASIYSTIGLTTEQRFGLGETLVDAQIGYDVTDSLYIYVQGQNLTNEAFQTKFDDADYATDQYFDYGRSYQAGFTYKF
ncbi:TonB-dependent receptor [Thalassotalea sp. 1_MG-2023]|uniref:TonB-dependent receptor n=1 Tax=Thalassotalea sp. 1_MG-2023 TaxID=3062680 RepID=UPI0026E40D29|nr:TonB-dependent receptor [Thalassotalea sp. 1_MG-2023]MDO6427129.1 TonB-dependent receptor [Thalassotalea sp. 1_MG-2023]